MNKAELIGRREYYELLDDLINLMGIKDIPRYNYPELAEYLFKWELSLAEDIIEKVKPEWHDLKKIPADLPKSYGSKFSVNVLTDTQEIAYIIYDTNTWIRDSSSTEIESPEAWTYIPEYIAEK